MPIKTSGETIVAAGVLLGFGLLKLLTLHKMDQHAIDPLFGVNSLRLSVAFGITESVAAIAILLSQAKLAARFTVAIGASFLLFRFLYSIQGDSLASCPCLGGANGLLPSLKHYENNILTAVAIWIPLLGFCALRRGAPDIKLI